MGQSAKIGNQQSSLREPGPPPLLEVQNLVKHFPVYSGTLRRVVGQVRAVDGVSFSIGRGETFSLVGESGCGKTTLGRSVLRLIEPSSGEVNFQGESIMSASAAELRALRSKMQIIFQDPYGSLNPRMTVEAIVSEGLANMGACGRSARRERVAEALERVGLDPGRHLRRYPHEFSGGQRQRIGIARALVVRPLFIVCDEAVSSLDVSVQAQIINLLMRLQDEDNYSYLFIAQDLSGVRHVSDHVGVMYLGRLAEVGPGERIHSRPHHPYTRALLASRPAQHPRERTAGAPLQGEVPSPIAPPNGCRFHTRCPFVMDRCRVEDPPAREIGPGHVSWCFLEEEG